RSRESKSSISRQSKMDGPLGLRHLERRPPGRAPGPGHGGPLRRRPDPASAPGGGLLRPTPQHTLQGKPDELASQRSRQERPGLQVQALGPRADFALVCQDEVESPQRPALARVWAPLGRPPEVPTPGTTVQQVVSGGSVDRRGRITDTVAAPHSGVNFLAVLVTRGAAGVGRQVVLVCDHGRSHTTQAVPAWWPAPQDQVESYFLPPYGPSRNLIERRGGHRKRAGRANVLSGQMADLVAAARRGLDDVTGQRHRLGFVSHQDDILGKTTKKAG